MPSGNKTKPHLIRWIEAERELALQGVVLSNAWAPFPIWPRQSHASD